MEAQKKRSVRSEKFTRIRLRRSLFIAGMLSIAIINFLVFWLYVNFNSILMAFQMQTSKGLVWTMENFERFFREVQIADFQLGLAIKNSMLLYVTGTFVSLPLSLLFAYYLFKKVVGADVFRVIFFLPSIISAAVLVTLFKYLVMPSGPVNELLSILTGQDIAIEWVVDEQYSMFTILFYTVWTGFGGNIVMLTGAIHRIPEDVIEYGKLEGISMTRELFNIVIPLMWPTLSTLIICSTAGLFTASGPVLLFTEGQFGTMTLGYFIFDKVQAGQYYYPASIGLIFTFIGVPITLAVKWFCDHLIEDVQY